MWVMGYRNLGTTCTILYNHFLVYNIISYVILTVFIFTGLRLAVSLTLSFAAAVLVEGKGGGDEWYV